MTTRALVQTVAPTLKFDQCAYKIYKISYRYYCHLAALSASFEQFLNMLSNLKLKAVQKSSPSHPT